MFTLLIGCWIGNRTDSSLDEPEDSTTEDSTGTDSADSADCVQGSEECPGHSCKSLYEADSTLGDG